MNDTQRKKLITEAKWKLVSIKQSMNWLENQNLILWTNNIDDEKYIDRLFADCILLNNQAHELLEGVL